VALAIFLFHIFTLVVLIIASLMSIANDGGETFRENWNYPFPSSALGGGRSGGSDLFLGFCVSLL